MVVPLHPFYNLFHIHDIGFSPQVSGPLWVHTEYVCMKCCLFSTDFDHNQAIKLSHTKALSANLPCMLSGTRVPPIIESAFPARKRNASSARLLC